MATKQCSECHENLPLNIYEKTGLYYRNICKGCRLKQVQLSRAKQTKLPKITLENKECKNCKLLKTAEVFNKRAAAKDGLAAICRDCLKSTRKKPSNIVSTLSSSYCIKCKTQKPILEFYLNAKSNTGVFSTCKSCWKPRVWNKVKQKASEQKYIANNPDKIKAKNARQGQALHRILKGRLRARIVSALKSERSYKSNRTIEYVGCSLQYLKMWIESQFLEGMTWETRDAWHIDHVMPCASFDLKCEDQQKQCFNWTNLRPIWKNENLTKSDRILPELINEQNAKAKSFLNDNPLPTHPGDRDEGEE